MPFNRSIYKHCEVTASANITWVVESAEEIIQLHKKLLKIWSVIVPARIYNSIFLHALHARQDIWFGRRTLRLSLALSSLVGAIGRAGLRNKEVGLLRPGPRGPKVLRHQMVRWSAGGTAGGEMVTPASRTTAVSLVRLNLTNMPCSVLPWQAAWQVILISLK